MSCSSRRRTTCRRTGLAPATLLLAATVGAADAPARAFGSGGDVAYRPVEAAAPQPLDGGGLRSPEELEAFVDGFVSGELEAYDVAGLTVAVVKDGQLFFAKGYGWADVDRRLPVEADKTLFRPGSVSKLFTWTAVMQLVEQGKLDLDADVNTYLTQFKIPATYPAPITLRHVLTHTVGLEDGGIGYLMARSPQQIVPLARSLAEHTPARVRPVGTSLARTSPACHSRTTWKRTSCAPSKWKAAPSRSRFRRRSRSGCRSATRSKRERSRRTATSSSRISAPPARWPPPAPTWPAS